MGRLATVEQQTEPASCWVKGRRAEPEGRIESAIEFRCPDSLVDLRLRISTFDEAGFPSAMVRVIDSDANAVLHASVAWSDSLRVLVPISHAGQNLMVSCSIGDLRGSARVVWGDDRDCVTASVVMAR